MHGPNKRNKKPHWTQSWRLKASILIFCFSSIDAIYCRRKGAGRKPKLLVNGAHPPSARVIEKPRCNVDDQSTLRSPPSGTSEAQETTGSHQGILYISSSSESLIDGRQTHSLLDPSPDVLPPSATPILDSQMHAPLSPTDAAQLVWDPFPSENPYMGCSSSSLSTTYNPQSPMQFSSPFECQSPYISTAPFQYNENTSTPRSETPTSRNFNPLDAPQSSIGDVDMLLDFPQGFSPPPCNPEIQVDSHSNAFYKSNTVVSSCEPATDALPLSQPLPSISRAIIPRDPFVPIAPAPLPPVHQQCTWVFPYTLLPNMTPPVHHLAIISQSSTHKRRRRRCVVCLQLGREEASYQCPGRGDRARCPSHRGDSTERLNVFKAKQKCDQKANGETKALLSLTSESMSTPAPAINHKDTGTCGSYFSQPATHPIPSKAMITTHILYPGTVAQPYVSLVPWGHSLHASQEYVIMPGERRSRRCMVCVTKDKDGTLCPGRGNRNLCPNREETADLVNTQ
jgi:hypothetical protein